MTAIACVALAIACVASFAAVVMSLKSAALRMRIDELHATPRPRQLMAYEATQYETKIARLEEQAELLRERAERTELRLRRQHARKCGVATSKVVEVPLDYDALGEAIKDHYAKQKREVCS